MAQTIDFKKTEMQMSQFLALMFASGRKMLELREEVTPMVHFFMRDGSNEVIAVPLETGSQEEKDELEAWLRGKCATGQYVGLLLLADTTRTILNKDGSVKDVMNALCVSYETPVESTTYFMPYVDNGVNLKFDKIYRTDTALAGRIYNLFNRSNLVQ
jgi:hypothetical protein